MIGSVNLALCELYMFQYLVNFNIAKIIKKNTMFWKVYIKKGSEIFLVCSRIWSQIPWLSFHRKL